MRTQRLAESPRLSMRLTRSRLQRSYPYLTIIGRDAVEVGDTLMLNAKIEPNIEGTDVAPARRLRRERAAGRDGYKAEHALTVLPHAVEHAVEAVDPPFHHPDIEVFEHYLANKAETCFIYVFCGEHTTGPTLLGVVTPDMLRAS